MLTNNEPTLTVGGDVHLDSIALRWLDRQSGDEIRPPLSLPNDRCGADQLIATLVQTLRDQAYTRLEFGWEATGLLWLPLYYYLVQSQELQAFQPRWVCFNPKLVADFKKGIALRPDKTDDKDALGVAWRLRFGDLPESYIPPPFWQALRRLTRYRFTLSHSLAKEKIRFSTLTFLKASEWVRSKPFSRVMGATSAALLTEFTLDELVQMPLDELTEYIRRQGHGRFADPAQTARHVQRALAHSYPVDPALDAAVTFTLDAQLDHIQQLEKLLKRLDREIARWMERVPNPLQSVAGLGAVITAGILAEIGEVARFAGHPQLARYAGLTWTRKASGSFVAEETQLNKAGNVFLRYYLIEGADQMRQHDVEYQAFYWRKYQEVPKHQHKRALVLTARKLVRLVHALLTSNQPDARHQPKSEVNSD